MYPHFIFQGNYLVNTSFMDRKGGFAGGVLHIEHNLTLTP